ncbi:MAG TPA: restriction endonuclease subunit S [Verrucomicrobiales bacterium]|nr:restriction endonuclease subunit S [Verrucomicrobiales bacterium]
MSGELEYDELPIGWASAGLGDLIKLKYGKALPDRVRSGSGFPVFGSNGVVGYHNESLTDGETIIVGRKGSVGEVHYCASACSPIDTTYFVDEFHGQPVKYWFRFLQSLELGSLNRATAIPGLNREDAYRVSIKLPPLAEQKRIADKLEAVLGRVDACRTRLDRVPDLLKRFRQSVLAAATSGRLTEDWREGGSTLGWQMLKVSDVGSVQLGRQRAPKYHHGENMRPYLRVQNVFEARLDLSDVMEMEFSEADFKRYKLSYGDILLNEGQSPQYLGRPAMYRDDLPGACFTNSLIRFRAKLEILNREYALLVFRHYMRSGRFAKEGSITTNIAHLSAGKFANIEFLLPPLSEQDEIVRRVEALFAFADQIEARLTQTRAKVERLTPATLAKAFRGELVPQDPQDEPASALVKCIADARNGLSHRTKPRNMGHKQL